jgi:hypothetical protein
MRHSRSHNTDPNPVLKWCIRIGSPAKTKLANLPVASVFRVRTDSGRRMAQLPRHLDTHNAYGDHIGKHVLRCHSPESLFPVKALFVVCLVISGKPFSFMVQKRVIKGRVSRVGYFNRCWIFWSLFPSFYSLLENQVQRFCLLLCS